MSREPLVGVYAGTFDPLHNGHRDIIRRAARVLDRLIVAVAINAGKGPVFCLEERVEMARQEAAAEEATSPRATIEVRPFESLLVHLCREEGAGVMIRGLRAISDFEFEIQMAAMNARQAPEVETLFLMASESHQFISSKLVKEIGKLGGDVSSLVSATVRARLDEKFR
jgi:pantetheine-phosphate adenylyltransferase